MASTESQIDSEGFVTPRRKRRNGRPPIDASGAGTRVSVRLEATTYDQLYALARNGDRDVAAVIRDAIKHCLHDANLSSAAISSAKTLGFVRPK